MTAGQLDLFRMNAHGDLWEEPELFAQGEAAAPALETRAGRWCDVHGLHHWTPEECDAER